MSNEGTKDRKHLLDVVYLVKKRCERMESQGMGGSSREMCMRDTADMPKLYELSVAEKR